MARRVVVAHPGHLRLVFRSKRKNDRIDPEKLAKLLYLGEIPPAYVPSPDIREWRAMTEYRPVRSNFRPLSINGQPGSAPLPDVNVSA